MESYQLPKTVSDKLLQEHLQELQTVCFQYLVTNPSDASEHILSVAKRLNIASSGYHTVCVLTTEAMSDAITQQMLLLHLKEVAAELFAGVGLQAFVYIESNIRLICVLTGASPDQHCAAVEATDRLCDQMKPLKFLVGIGSWVTGLEKLHYAMHTAMTDLERQKEIAYATGNLDETAMRYRDQETIQTILLQKIRDNDYEGVETAIREHTAFLRKNISNEISAVERFLVRYLQSITNECLRMGVTLERFESYVPTVVCMLQRDNDGCVEQMLKLTDQIMKHMSVHRTSESNHLLNMAKDYVRDHLGDETLNLEAVSDHVGLSRVYFCKLFHQMEGVSFNTYLTRVRMEKAKQLLLATNMKVYEVSNAVGFSHAKYFSQVFKQSVGQTPVEFQRCANE